MRNQEHLEKYSFFSYNNEWEDRFFEEKEVRVYYKFIDGNFVLLTVKARYGKFSKGGI